MSNIYLNIKKILKQKKHINQNDIAAALKVSRNTVSNWVNKEIGLRAEQVPEIAKVLRVSIPNLYGLEDGRQVEEQPQETESLNVSVFEQLYKEEREKNERLVRENERVLRDNERLLHQKVPYRIAGEE